MKKIILFIKKSFLIVLIISCLSSCKDMKQDAVKERTNLIAKSDKVLISGKDKKKPLPIPRGKTEKKTIQELKKEAEKLFENTIDEKLRGVNEVLENSETYIGDLTRDGLQDVIIWYVTYPEDSPFSPVTERMRLYVNEKNSLKQYSDFAPQYMFSVKSISNNVINIMKYDYEDTDEPRNPSISIPEKIILSKKNNFLEVN
ncbi:hypothetical protein FNW52_11490 [Flavobacterium sp. ZT3R18]|uniref:hypothetical protein n=1 Tax=Flavobacterium sp. ZT3R18 TaxID=2594429 RepID=UPI001179AE32|nr:hypothetical protein [Flavobacterium sp. ZT3R18]TRX35336.1 hypothetical protein FNW52_11490 [Flavobacterium sp. ZT3R18]